MDVTVVEVSLHVVVVVSVPRLEDDSVVLGRAEVNHDVVRVADLCRLHVDLKILLTAERHYRRICTNKSKAIDCLTDQLTDLVKKTTNRQE